MGKPRLLCSVGQGKRKRKKDETNGMALQRKTGKEMKKKDLGKERDVKMIKKSKTNNKIR